MTTRDFLIFIAGAAFAFCMVIFLASLEAFDRWLLQRRRERPVFFLDFTLSSATREGRDAVAASPDHELSQEGGRVTPPSHLRVVRDDKAKHADGEGG